MMDDDSRERPIRPRPGRISRRDVRHRGLPVVILTSALVLAVAGAAAYMYVQSGNPSGPVEPSVLAPRISPPSSSGQGIQVRSVTEDLAAYGPALAASGDPYFGTYQIDYLLSEMERPTDASHSWYVSVRVQLAFHRLRFGEAGAAITLLDDALSAEQRDDPGGDHRPEILEGLALANLKLGEQSNCLSPSGRLFCVLPLDNSLAYRDKTGSTNAIAFLTDLLELDPADVRYRWLLNIAHMTLGTYPEEVPELFLAPPRLLESSYDVGRFNEIAPEVGLYAVNLAGGSIIEDFDNDGLLDIVTSTWDPSGTMRYYHNSGDGRFSDHTARAGLSDQLGGLNIVQTDYNNDGWADVLVMRGGWMLDNGRMRMSLLNNNGDGTFTDVTHMSGLARPAYPSQSAAWADFDNDGDLDLFSCNESMPEPGSGSVSMMFPSQLYLNNGDGTFTDIAFDAGVTNFRYCKGSAWGDFDDDGNPDLYVSNFGGENRLYRNEGDGSFTDVAAGLGVAEPVDSFATWFWDYDNDGLLDLFVAGYGTDVADVAADHLRLPNDGGRPRLYRNLGAGGFEDVTREAGLHRVHLTMGANFGDLDNDGFLDFYLGTGYPSYDALGPNVAYRNNGDGTFSDVTFSAGLGHLQKGHGIAFGDLDRDGDQDIFVQVGGFYPGDGFGNALYENPGHGNRWLSVRMVGTESNRAAIGATIEVNLEMIDGTERTVYAHVTSGGSFGASSLEQEIGLGDAHRVLALETYWPASDTRQTFTDVPLDSAIEITEGEDHYRVLDMRPLELATSP